VIIIIICIVLLDFDDVVVGMGMVMEMLLYYELLDVILKMVLLVIFILYNTLIFILGACYIKRFFFCFFFMCVFCLCICDSSVLILLQIQLPYGDK